MTPLCHPKNIISFPVRAFTLRKTVQGAANRSEAMEAAFVGLDELHCLLAYCRDMELPQSAVPLGFIRRTRMVLLNTSSRQQIESIASAIADELMDCELHIRECEVEVPALFVMHG